MKAKNTGKALALTLAAVSIFAFAGASLPANGNVAAYATANDVEFWSAYSTEKVLQDNVEIYDDIKKEAVVNVAAIGGEEEATQIIMTSGDKAVKEYDVTVSNLTGDNGETFAKENVKVYHERYIYVGKGGEYYTESGYYPDCLAPFEGVKKVGETGFKANNNQGLYISFKVPQNQKAGTYTGNIQIKIGGESKTIPVTLKVVDGFITEETHVKSSFLNEWYFYRGELDTTEEMFDAYNQKLFEYRLGCNNVTVYEEDVQYYAEKVCQYAKQTNCPGYNIPWKSKNYSGSGYVLNGRELNCPHSYDVDSMLSYLRTIAYEGLKENVDPFKKAFIYGWDEPDLGLGVASAKIHTREWSYIVEQCQLMVAEELELDESIENTELRDTIIESLLDVPHLILSSTFLDNDFDLSCENAVYCPEFQYLESEGARDLYRLSEENDLWWYGCVQPTYPYPTYHIDDTVLSARLESWMKADYNIQGNLYWSTTLYSEPAVNNVMVYPEDFYSGNAARTLSVEGEGFLFYPGKKYGVYGPIPSMRLEQIRDGLEEYEMIIKMAEIYKNSGTGYTEDAIMRYLYDTMYLGTKVSTTAENFENNRKLLLSLFEMASSKAQVCVANVEEAAGGYTFEVFAKNGYTLKQAGKEVTNKQAVDGGYLYTINLQLSQSGLLDLSVDVDNKTYGFTLSFGNEASTYNATYANEKGVVQKRYVDVTTELVNANTVNPDAAATDKYIQVKLAAATEQVRQDFLLVDPSVIRELDKTVNKVVIRIYNASNEKVSGELSLRLGNKKYSNYGSIELAPGMNTLTIGGFAGMRWHEIQYIDYFRIIVGELNDGARDTLYYVDMTVYK